MNKRRGKNIQLYLMDGEASGRIKCTLANWTGVAYKIPRTMLEEANDIEYLNQTGVYFLFGYSDETDELVAYIGQAGVRKNGRGIIGRLEEHKKNSAKDYWTEAVAFTTSNNTFGPTEISYLENRFCNISKDANRYIIKNEIEPTKGNITEEKESELEEFIDYSKLIMGALGYKVFEPIIAKKKEVITENEEDEQILYFTTKTVNASGKITTDGFAVLKGSKLSKTISKSCPKVSLRAREKYKDKIDSDFVLQIDVNFPSPSSAASFVSGASASGNISWKDENGVKLGDL